MNLENIMRYAILALFCLLSSQAFADPKGLEPLPDVPPPPVVKGEDQPEVTIKQKGEEKI